MIRGEKPHAQVSSEQASTGGAYLNLGQEAIDLEGARKLKTLLLKGAVISAKDFGSISS
jgi:hypothetical protein